MNHMRLIVNGKVEGFPREMVASAAVARLGHDPNEYALRYGDGSWVGSARTLGEALSDDDALELVRIG